MTRTLISRWVLDAFMHGMVASTQQDTQRSSRIVKAVTDIIANRMGALWNA